MPTDWSPRAWSAYLASREAGIEEVVLIRGLLHGRWAIRGRCRGVAVAVADVVAGLQGAAFSDDGEEHLVIEGVFPEDEVAEVPRLLVKAVDGWMKAGQSAMNDRHDPG